MLIIAPRYTMISLLVLLTEVKFNNGEHPIWPNDFFVNKKVTNPMIITIAADRKA
jgi:hypothetical protein